MSSKGPKELLELLPLSGQIRGEADAVEKCLEDNKIDLNKIVSIATDGARSMTGRNKGYKKIKDEFDDRFEQFKTNKTTLAFIVNHLNTNSNEIHSEPFGIDTGSLEMQLKDLKSKDL
ncbi:uncharacterized protein TNCV_1340731 [Trichonephila clavipes]|nr:uncharacterized protein TNCV_1340731 [Trichonephila clavipes]